MLAALQILTATLLLGEKCSKRQIAGRKNPRPETMRIPMKAPDARTVGIASADLRVQRTEGSIGFGGG